MEENYSLDGQVETAVGLKWDARHCFRGNIGPRGGGGGGGGVGERKG